MTRARQPLTPGNIQAKNCPVCARPTAARYAPFCSKRCSDVDLGRWLNEGYAFPVSPEEDSAAAIGEAMDEAAEAAEEEARDKTDDG